MNYQHHLDRLRSSYYGEKYWDDPRRTRVMQKLLAKVMERKPYGNPAMHRWAETMWF